RSTPNGMHRSTELAKSAESCESTNIDRHESKNIDRWQSATEPNRLPSTNASLLFRNPIMHTHMHNTDTSKLMMVDKATEDHSRKKQKILKHLRREPTGKKKDRWLC